MIARPFRYLAAALAALGLIALRRTSRIVGSAAGSSRGAEEGRVVFRHYL